MMQYPGTNFHDLNLDWILNQVKNCLAEWATTKGSWEEVQADWTETKSFILNYFANLDVSEEVNAKITEMANDGSLLALIAEQVATTSATATTAWLADHVDPETGYVLDTSLTVQGAAADAKAAGDAINAVKTVADTLNSQVTGTTELTWTQGRAFNANGYVTSNRWATSNILPAGTYTVHVPTGYRYQLAKYVSDSSGVLVTNTPLTVDWTGSVDGQFIISAANAANSALTNDDMAAIQAGLTASNVGTAIAPTVTRLVSDSAELRASALLMAFADSTAITAGADLDTYKTVGTFNIANAALAAQISNVPVAAPGKLIVCNTSDAGSGVQVYVTNFGDIYTRQYNASVVGSWNRAAFMADVPRITTGTMDAIPSGSDLNNYNTPGMYKRVASNVTISNLPEAVPGVLLVMTTATTNNLTQIYIGTTGNMYTRYKDANGWKTWDQIVYTKALSKYDVLDSAALTAIPANSDLNTYTTPGTYKVAGSNISSTTANIPVNAPGKLLVQTTATANNIVQNYIDSNGRTWMRTKDARGWSTWIYLVESTEADNIRDAADGIMGYVQTLIAGATYNLSFANAPVPLAMKNYLGNNQNVHPKVMYFANGFGGHNWWMAYTPYPYMNDDYENPCIAWSNDGYTWTNIAGNPLDDPAGDGYNSDTHLVYNSTTQMLECWYRYVTESRQEVIYRQTSADGLTWSAKQAIMTSAIAGAAHYLSPAVIYDGTQYQIWVVDNGTIKFYTALPDSITAWTLVRSYNLTFTEGSGTANAWHLDVIKDGSDYVMLVMTQQGTTLNASSKWSLFLTTSGDNITYTTPVKVMEGSAYGWDKLLYRSSIVKLANGYRIYYSGADYDRSYHLAISESSTLSGFIGKYIMP